jgi:hypothetical protein
MGIQEELEAYHRGFDQGFKKGIAIAVLVASLSSISIILFKLLS